MEIKRSNKEYIEVEAFKEYEFTSCIAYEMMIRHPRVIEIVRYECFGDTKPKDYDTEEGFSFYGISDMLYVDYHFLNLEKNEMTSNKGIFDTYKNTDDSIKIFKEYEGFIKNSHLSKDGGPLPYYENNLVIRYFSRPEVKIYEIDNNISISLDLSKPTNEIMAYIQHLKKAYDNNIFNCPYDDFIENITKHTHGKMPKGSVMADILFIYDALKLGYSKRKIQNEIYNYYADKGIETRTMDYKTLKKYYEFAIDYIDNKKYLELATGKKLEDIKLGTLLNK